MDHSVLTLLDLAQGPLFRATVALLVLGSMRACALAASDTIAAYVTLHGDPVFWRKLRLRLAWHLTPSLVLQQAMPVSRPLFAYHVMLCVFSLILRIGAITVPVFMIAHVYLWERGLGVAWPTLPMYIGDVGAIITIAAGLALFFGRLYSPVIRKIEPPWAFAKPLILVAPFVTGLLAMHTRLSPLSWHTMTLLHVLTACLAFVMVPFGGLLICMHAKLVDIMPSAAWRSAEPTPSTNHNPAAEPGGTS